METVSDEHGERFRQDISQAQKRYSGQWSPYTLADCYWSVVRKTSTGEYKREKKTNDISLLGYHMQRHCSLFDTI
jgi:hypothetical protein